MAHLRSTTARRAFIIKNAKRSKGKRLQKMYLATERAIGYKKKRDKENWLHEGTEVEYEHRKTLRKLGVRKTRIAARMIAKDHLKESPNYYRALKAMEKKLKRRKR